MTRARKPSPLLAISLAAAALLASCGIGLDDDIVDPPPPLSDVELTFLKSGGEGGIWTGTVSGAFEGGLTAQLQDSEEDEEEEGLLHVSFLWLIDAGENSFTADLSGTVHFGTGVAEMEGEVIEAADPDLVGLPVVKEGQLVEHDPETDESTFEGTITVRRLATG